MHRCIRYHLTRCALSVFVATLIGGVVYAGAEQSRQRSLPPLRPVALVGGTLIDGSTDSVIRNSVILIEGERIQAVGTVDSLPIPSNFERISTEGMTVLPGLWEMHAHLMYLGHPSIGEWNSKYLPVMAEVIMPAAAEQLLMAGVTSARDAMAPLDAIVNVKRRIARGEIPGPSLYVAGALLTNQAAPAAATYQWALSGAADARAKVRRLKDAGADIIKLLCGQTTAEENTAIVEEAHAQGMIVMAHGRADAEIRTCLAGGVDEFEHLSPQAELPPDIVSMIRERVSTRRLLWTPTVGMVTQSDYLRTNREMLDDPSWQRGVPPEIVADMRSALLVFPPSTGRGGAPVPSVNMAVFRRKFNQLRELGVQLIVGSDAGVGGQFHSHATWIELDAWVNQFGVEPMAAIRSATSIPAAVMGVERDYGSVSAGKYADVIAVRGDPLRHMDVLRDSVVVLKHGRRYR